MAYSAELIPRILRDINDGVLALDKRGRIIYTNPQSRALLDINENAIGKSYAEIFFGEHQSHENDAFHQLVIDAVYSKEQAHYGSVKFIDKTNTKRYLRITSSFLKNESENDSAGVVMVMSDITETEVLKKKRYDADVVFSCVITCVCLYLLLLYGLFGIKAKLLL